MAFAPKIDHAFPARKRRRRQLRIRLRVLSRPGGALGVDHRGEPRRIDAERGCGFLHCHATSLPPAHAAPPSIVANRGMVASPAEAAKCDFSIAAIGESD
ncbi:MAG TPA: hypothetical protein VFA50_16565 [Stellaceae bacterium]|nr:hypothetical protein [Stellaceae bacterium]